MAMIILLAIGFAAAGAPLVAVVLVSVASHSEERACSLDRPTRSPINWAARRLLNFRSESKSFPRPKNWRPSAWVASRTAGSRQAQARTAVRGRTA